MTSMAGRLAVGLAALAAVPGCSGRRDRPPTYPVTGKVLYQGQAVGGADVAFSPKTPGPTSKPARGRTDAQGQFRLHTYFSPDDDTDGAIADQYLVTIRKIEVPEGMIDPERQRPPPNLLPARYDDPKHSDLSATVTAEGPNTFQFTLTK